MINNIFKNTKRRAGYSLTLTHSLIHSLSPILTHYLSLTRSLPLPHSHSHSLPLTHSHSLTHSRSLTLAHSLSLPLSLSLTHSHSLTLITHSLSSLTFSCRKQSLQSTLRRTRCRTGEPHRTYLS